MLLLLLVPPYFRHFLVLTLGPTIDFAEYLIADALENCISAFDGFGRTSLKIFAVRASDPSKLDKVSFQNLIKANTDVEKLFNLRLQNGVGGKQWEDIVRAFQKRHLLAHRMGVTDQSYLDATGDPQAVVGRKIVITDNEVKELAASLEQLGSFLLVGLRP